MQNKYQKTHFHQVVFLLYTSFIIWSKKNVLTRIRFAMCILRMQLFVKTASRRVTSGSRCACALPAGMSVVAIAQRTSMRPGIFKRPIILSSGRSPPAANSCGAMWMRCIYSALSDNRFFINLQNPISDVVSISVTRFFREGNLR